MQTNKEGKNTVNTYKLQYNENHKQSKIPTDQEGKIL